MRKNHIFIFGLGYVGQHLAHALSARGWQVTGTTRSPEKLAGLIPETWHILKFEDGIPVPDLASRLQACSHLISTISALLGHDPVLTCHDRISLSFAGWTGYVSATSVYPDQEDGFVDERTPADPATKRGKARLAAERQWQELSAAEIFRIAGIYGPHRNALLPFAKGGPGSSKI